MFARWSFSMSALYSFIGLLMLGCAHYPVGPQSQKTVEQLKEVDTFRGQDGPNRSLDYSLSKDPVFIGFADRPTTVGIQSKGPISRIALSDVLLETLKNNRDIRVEDYNRTIACDAITAAKGIYDLLINASTNYQKSNTPTSSIINGEFIAARNEQRNCNVSLQQLLPTGGVIELFTSGVRNNDFSSGSFSGIGAQPIDPFHTASVGISFTQPLLKGFGPYVTNAPIYIAQAQDKIEQETFRSTVINTLSNAINGYWDLVFALNNYEVQNLSLDRAKELLRTATIKRDAGVEPPTVVLQAEAEVARQNANVISAVQTISQSQDNLKKIMNITEGSEEWQYNLIPIDKPGYAPMSLNEEAIYAEALELRPEYRTALFNLDILDVQKNVAKNNTLPQLNAVASYQRQGIDDSSYTGALDNAEDHDYYIKSAGLQFSYPLQNRTARANYKASISRVEQQNEQLKNVADSIRLEVRTAIRNVETNLKLIDAFASSVRAEQANYDSQLKRFQVGFATIFEVIQFQENLATAQGNYVKSLVDFNKSVINLQRVKSSFLDDYKVTFLQQPVNARLEAQQKGATGPTPPAALNPNAENPIKPETSQLEAINAQPGAAPAPAAEPTPAAAPAAAPTPAEQATTPNPQPIPAP